MRTLVIVGLFFAVSAKAQVVSVECPSSYPPKPATFVVAPPGHNGKGLMPANNPVKDWGVFDGEFGDPAQIHADELPKVSSGSDTKVPPVRWFVCYYRGGISWWEETGADRAASTGQIKVGCIVQAREKGKAFKLVCK